MLRVTLLGALALGIAHGAACDRVCLKATLDQYLNAIIQHNPAAAPLSIGFRQTENAMVRRPGTGLWQSAKALGKLQRRYFDPESGQAGYFGTLQDTSEDASGSAIVTLRLKVEDRKITERSGCYREKAIRAWARRAAVKPTRPTMTWTT